MKLFSRIWLAALVLLCLSSLLAMTFNVWPGIPVRNNIMRLLPELRDDAVLLQALERSSKSMSRQLLILVGDSDTAITDRAAQQVTESLATAGFFSEPVTGMDAEQSKTIGKFYYDWRHVLLADNQRQLLASKNYLAFEQQLTQTIYSPVSGINAAVLTNDPFLTYYHFLRSLPAEQEKLKQVDGHTFVQGTDLQGKHREYRVILVELKEDAFDMDFHPRYQTWREQLQENLQTQYPHTELLLMGAVQHALWGASSSKREVSVIGNGSLLGIIILMIVVFRGARALLANLLPLGMGVIAGLAATLLCYGEIHLITLVFGSSVIGVAMDYSLHYLAEHYKTSTDTDNSSDHYRTLRRVFPGITFAMVTSVIAYAAIGFAPFPVLRQIAIFSCAGLIMAWFTVVSLYPHILPALAYKSNRWLALSGKFDKALCRCFDHKVSTPLIFVLVVAMLPGIFYLHADDDLRLLQTPQAQISATEKRIQSFTGQQPDVRYFLVEGKTEEQVLQRSEELGDWLASQQLSADLITRYLPSQQRQQENNQALQDLFSGAEKSFAQHWQQAIGLSPAIIQKAQQAKTWMLTADVMATPLQQGLQRFQLTPTDRGFIVAGFVKGSAHKPEVDFSALRAWAEKHEGVHWMDSVSDISQMFKQYREGFVVMMFAAYSVIALLLIWRYGYRSAWRVLLAPALAAWITLGLLGYAGAAINLFHVLALLLVLGVGIDYSIFFAESSEHRDSTMLAVILSTITTMLSFGLLALSQTAAISSFGLVVSIGMICSLLFSPLAQHHPKTAIASPEKSH